jgi:hypothetical protein
VGRIIDRIEIDGTLRDSVDVIRQVLRAKAERTAEVNQFLAERKEAGARLDPATAEISRHHAQVLDPYGVLGDELDPEEQCVGKQYFARHPGSDWISFYDLPEKTVSALRERIDAGAVDKDDVLPF